MFGNTGLGGFGAQTQAAFGSTPTQGAFGSGFGTFGQPQQPAFGAAASTPAFGAASTPAFGAASAPAFGASPAPAFGASPTPAFGAASTPAFGAAATGSAFGATSAAFGAARPAGGFGGFGATGAFGASQPAFGSGLGAPAFGQSTSAFGAPASAPAFGASSSPAFGAPGAFGSTAPGAASPFGGASTSAFGAPAAAPSFGAPAGGGLFGAPASSPATSPFGATAAPATGGGLFGAPAAGSPFGGGAAAGQPTGSRVAPYQRTVDRDGTTATGAATTANYMSISAMPAYQNKSFEELRWEDYQAGVKSAAAGPAAAPAATANPFGTPAAGGAFGGGLGAAGTPAFGSPSPGGSAFGAPASTPAFGGGGLFGGQSTPAFGSAAPAFGAASSPFGTTSPAPAFGAAASQPAFGSAFGAASASAFGASAIRPASSASAFSFNTAPSLFGATSSPAFGTSTAPSLFGTTAPAPAGGGLFGAAASSPGVFGSTFGSTPPGGATGGAFGGLGAFGASRPATTSAFGGTSLFGAATGGAFGAGGGGLFGQTGGGMFGSSAFPAGGSTAPSLFASSSPSLFGANTGASLFGATTSVFGGGGMFAGATAGAPAAAAPAAPLNVSAAPYGAFPTLPAVPEPKVGIGARPPSRATSGANTPPRASPLVSLRATASGLTGRVGGGAGLPNRPAAVSTLGSLGAVVPGESAGAGSSTNAPDASATSFGTAPQAGTGSGTPSVLRARPNPHQLFIREPPPATQGANGASAFTPARAPSQQQQQQQQQHFASATIPVTPARTASPSGSPLNPSPSPPQQQDMSGAGGTSARAAHPDGAFPTPPSPPARSLPRLGTLEQQGYSYSPPPAQLTAMASSDPDALTHIANFTISRAGVGSIRWLQPVDVRGLALDQIVSIEKGEASCYVQGVKPPVGQGLNCPAEVTLLNIYKVDRTTGAPVKDGPLLAKWEKSLRSMCAKMGARFIAYKAAGGVWKFEVEHFSRYGLLPESDETDEDDEGVDMDEEDTGAGLQQGRGLAQPDSNGHAGVEEEEDEEDEEEADGAGAPGAATPLQHALPVSLGLQPTQLLMMRDAFFAPGPSREATLPPATRQPCQAGRPPHSLTAPALPTTPATATDASAFVTLRGRRPPAWRTPAPAMTTSSRPIASFTPAGLSLALVASGDRDAGSPRLPALPAPGGELAVVTAPRGPASPPFPGPALDRPEELIDAGFSLGLSFRVGWGPDGRLVIPGPPGQGRQLATAAQPITVKRALVEGRREVAGAGDGVQSTALVLRGASPTTRAPQAQAEAAPDAARAAAMRALLRGVLSVHAKYSRTVPPAPAPEGSSVTSSHTYLPQRRLECSAAELPALVTELVAAAQLPTGDALVGEAGPSHLDPDVAAEQEHVVEAWRLLKVLFEEPPAGLPLRGGSGSSTGNGGADDDDADDGGMGDPAGRSGAADAPLLAALHRQAGFSGWLRRQIAGDALRDVAAAPTPQRAVLHLLAGHHLPGAAAVAAASGDVRLATLIASVGARPDAQAAVTAQLSVWSATHMGPHIDPDRLLIYKLLAGEVLEPCAALALDWRRALGLMLWYGVQPGGDPLPPRHKPGAVAATVTRYGQLLVEHQGVPWPLPAWAQGDHARTRLGPGGVPLETDLHFELMYLWAVQQMDLADARAEAEAQGDATVVVAAKPQFATPGLLAAGSHSANPCAAAVPWVLLGALQALGALRGTSDADVEAAATEENVHAAAHVALAVAAHTALISQLVLLGGLPEWALYVALHLPDASPAVPCCRNRVVRQLLELTAPQWVGHPEREPFLRDTLGLPEALMAAAAATWATAQGDSAAACAANAAAGQWAAAHALLVDTVAPSLLLGGRLSELSELVQWVAPGAATLPGWRLGAGLYDRFLGVFHRGQDEEGGPSPQPTPVTAPQALQALALDIAEARGEAAAALAPDAAPISTGPRLLGVGASGSGAGLLQRLVALDSMARRVQGALLPALAETLAHGVGGVDVTALCSACGVDLGPPGLAVGATAVLLTRQLLQAQ